MKDLETERLLLHPLDPAEAERLLTAGQDGDPGRAAHWSPGYPTDGDLVAARKFLRACDEDIPGESPGGDPRPYGPYRPYEVRLRDGGRAIGGVGFHGPPDEAGSVTIGYSLIPAERGRGYATEALRGLLAHARESGVRRVEGDAGHDNAASQRVMRAAGMERIGEDEEVAYYATRWEV
ncbi:GNAT family N-acetyltransferase [Streptomyces clavuligerus]|uniref:GNAT family N-acetyltransferase n=1 Tax=Streptomyces clavuligerus TaxID=1901 RepID=UPI00020D9448|nr:GNAT family N-acetyltransferase [Streptomyces clavuligerus]ANW19371.1 acetyltransferase [Streptomyces clavuligerus]AXU13974.1 N-acetyltransferase [Streptomyces clavuligerus]MBY6303949.1 GNAT family N-acetyltransferase [Streptomyces clavuligerus]QCS06748.1 N-acetyltransferase [Streptomyces clavuligerus]QPJ93901.1 GNAT family N-acetyltransferase [Streptomyces clavuligerus]